MRVNRSARAARAAVAAAAVAALALVCAFSGRAAADPARAWAAAKESLPSQAALVVGADLTVITKSQLWGQLLARVFAQEPSGKLVLETIRSSCKIDPVAAIHGVVFATDADRKGWVLYLALGGGVDQAKLLACYEAVAKASGAGDTKLAVKKAGAITEIALDRRKSYVGWIGSDVLVLSSDPGDRALLERWMGGKGALARSTLGKIGASANTKGALWGATADARELDKGMRMKSAHGALTASGGNLVIDLHLTLDSAKMATEAVARAKEQIAQVAGSGVPGSVKTMLQGITIKASGAELSIRASVPEGELLGLLSMIGS